MFSAMTKKVIGYNRAKTAFLSHEDVVQTTLSITEECSLFRDPKDPIIHFYKMFLQHAINNIGDPFSSSKLFVHTKEFEVEVIRYVASLYDLEEDNVGGYVEWDFRRSELFTMNIILHRFDEPPIFLLPLEVSQRVIPLSRIFDVSREQIRVVRPDPVSKGMNLAQMAQIIEGLNEKTPLVVWLSLGDNNGAMDNLNEVNKVLKGRQNVHIHYSCSNLGVIAPYMENDLGISFQNGVDSLALPISDFFGVPLAGAVTITRKSFSDKSALEYDETKEKDSTIAGSRIGHLQLMIWIALKARGDQGIKEEIARVQKNCCYLKKTLEMNGKDVEIDEYKTAIFVETYSNKLILNWNLGRIIGSKNTYKFVMQPHYTKSKLDSFIEECLSASPKQKVLDINEIPDKVQKLYPLSEADQSRLHDLKLRYEDIDSHFIGFPGNLDFPNKYVKDILKIFEYDITQKSVEKMKKELFEYMSTLLRIPLDEIYAVITTGGSLSNLIGLLMPRNYFQDSIGYVSEDAHYSIEKVSGVIRMKCVVIKSQSKGELNYEELEKKIIENQPRPVVISLNIGSTMQGAIDSITKVKSIFKKLNITRYHIHCDAALDGGYLQFINDAPHYGFDVGIDSLAISLHKYVGSPIPCSIFVTRKNLLTHESKEIIENIFHVKDGVIAALIWYAINHQRTLTPGLEAKLQLEKANYLYEKLKEIPVNTWKNDFSNIVCFKQPSDDLIYKWKLCTMDGFTHVVVMQHVTYDMLNEFIEDFRKEMQKK